MRGVEKKPLFVLFANFCGVNALTTMISGQQHAVTGHKVRKISQ